MSWLIRSLGSIERDCLEVKPCYKLVIHNRIIGGLTFWSQVFTMLYPKPLYSYNGVEV